MTSEPLIIKDWQQGMAPSPYLGFGLMKNVNIEELPGALKVSKTMTSIFHTALSVAFTANAGTDVCTIASGTLPITGMAVTFSNSGGALPAGLAAGTIYFINRINSTTFYVYDTLANADGGGATGRVNITDAGTGTHTVATVNPGTINHIVKDPRLGNYFLHDSNARVWFYDGVATYLLPGNTLTNGAGKGIVLMRTIAGTATWLFVFRNAKVDCINVYGTSNLQTPVWTNDWQSLTGTAAGTSNSHHAIFAQDNIIYFCDGKNVGSIKEATNPFAPADAGNFNASALDLPPGEISNWLEELDTDLLIAGNNYDKIYPWDRISDSFNLPIIVPETSVKKLKNIGGKVYILAGNRGSIYSTQGTGIKLEGKIPEYASNSASSLANSITWGGIGSKNGSLIFGASCLTSASSGVWILHPDGRILKDNEPSTGAGNAVAIFSEGEFYLIGYDSGADKGDTTRRSSYAGVVHTALYPVALKNIKATYSRIEVQLAKPAASGNIRIGYRTDTESAFTTLKTIACDGSTSYDDAIGLQNLENIQLQVEMDGIPELLEIRLLP